MASSSTSYPEDCKRGLHCEKGRQNLSTCPAGFSCPDRDSPPLLCPEGTFRPAEGTPSHSCAPCPVHFFNAKRGQAACYPCGSEAAQPKEGQKTCACLRQGRVFQPSDAQCPCAPGHKSPSGDRRLDCVKRTFPICRDETIRNQEGQCLTKEEWIRYCSEKVCTLPKDYQGYDKVLGLCLCQSDNLDHVCNPQCRWRQGGLLQLVCDQEAPRLSVTYKNGSQVEIFLEEITTSPQVLDFHAHDGCASEKNQDVHPVYVVKTNGKSDREDSRLYKAQMQPSNSTLKMMFSGILNPTTCLKIHDMILFIVSKEHYPVYDVNNLYNTNSEFDWGRFRSLAEEAKLAPGSRNALLFFYQFHDPGTFVFRLSSNQHKRMYIRVLPYGGQCSEEGPFFPTTPRYVIQVGIAKIPDLTLKTDWPVIGGIIIGLLLLLIVCLLLILLCQVLSWPRSGSPCPRFRKLQQKYNLDKYSSHGSMVIAVKKYHPGAQKKNSLEESSNQLEKRGKCEMWNSEEQIDLDSFNTNIFFEILLTQSLAVTAKLSQFKEELKILYHKVLDETASLRELWVARMCIPDTADPGDKAVMGNYAKAKEEAEAEILRRRRLAAEYEESVTRQHRLLTQDLKGQEEHWVTFHSSLREAARLMEMLTDALASEDGQSSGSEGPDHQRLLSLIDAVSSRMSSAVREECQRLMAWGVLGEGLGAQLVNKERTRLLPKEELIGPGGSVKAHDVVYQDATSGLIMPTPDAVMLLANQSLMPVSSDHFLHPDTGKMLPIAGNVGYSPANSKLISVADYTSGELHRLEVPVFPFVPYPISPRTGLPVKSNLPVLQPEKIFKLGGFMQDPTTEIEVPILAVTLHPQTGQKLSLGGTYLNPLTGTVTPLELGGPMRAPEGGEIVPILGVALDSNTGDVVPLGGLTGPSESFLLLGDSFIEPLSGKTARVQGACLLQGKVVPHAGGYQALLEANLLLTQVHTVKVLREYKDSICQDPGAAGDGQRALKAAEEDMITALSQGLNYSIFRLRSLEKQRAVASNLKSTGGKLGMIKFPSTELWIPAVFGMKIPDPGGSHLAVPILGVECDWKTGQPIPLAGTTEDANGKGLAPIAVGFRTIDPVTGETGPVIGAQINPWTNAVIPIVQSLGSLPRGNPDPDLLAALDKEIHARQAYWECQREKEEELLRELDFLFLHILEAAKQGKMKKVQSLALVHVKYRSKLKPAEELCHFLDVASAQETQRRVRRDLNALWNSEQYLQTKCDKDERDQEARVMLLLRKVLERLVQFVRKVQMEEGRIQMQLKETERGWSRSVPTEESVREKSRKITLHLVAEFQEHIAKQQASVESAYCRLEYLRYLSDTQTLQTKVRFASEREEAKQKWHQKQQGIPDLLSGSTQCFVNYQSTGFYNIISTPRGSWEVINRKLIPLLKTLVQKLEEDKRDAEPPEMLLGLESGEGYSSRSTLKVSEAFRSETGQEAAPPALLSPALPSLSTAHRSQLLQETQLRMFLEKHASEMVHLELSLLAKEMNMISHFWDSSKGKRCAETASSMEWQGFLKDLADQHLQAERELSQQHWEELKGAGLSPKEFTLQEGLLFSPEEILQSLASLVADLQKEDSTFGVDPEQQDSQCLCPKNILQALDHLGYRVTGEQVAHEVAQVSETQLVARAVAFVQEHHLEGDFLVQLKEGNEAELWQLQTLIKTELQAQIEAKLQAEEAEAIRRAEKMAPSPPTAHIMYFLLTQRHLRQTVHILGGDLRLQKTTTSPPEEDGHPGDLPVEGPQVDDDLKSILQMLKERRGYARPLLELKQTVQMLQLRERQFQEVAQALRGLSSDQQHLDDADQITRELQEFRQQKIQELKEQLRILALQRQRTSESSSSSASPFWLKSPMLEKEGKERARKERLEVSQEMRLEELEESYRGQVSAEGAKLQDQLERGEIQRHTRQTLVREHDETVTFLDKAFHQDAGKLRGKVEKEKKKKEARRKSRNALASEAASSRQQGQPDPAEDRDLFLLAQNIAIFRQTELLVTTRITLLNPWIRCLLTGAASSFQDIMNIQMPPGSGELVPLPPPSLSAKEFVIFQYGTVILQFLRPLIGAPEIELCIASSIPASNAPGNAFRDTFYYLPPDHKLFVLRKCLSCVGSFVLLLVHCLAHIAAGNLSQDSDPAFRRLFYQALKACLGEMFSLRLQTSAVLEDSKSAARVISEAFLKGEEITDEKINLLSDLFGARMKAAEEDLLKGQLSKKEEGCYSCIFSEGQKTSAMSSVAGSCPQSVPEAAEGSPGEGAAHSAAGGS
ncbi:uncharacterized protein LOC143822002 [Paroedura picta]|uniref:uncharacterized protein LOC143822002 n=1 Tax=Paroedura picta TaxID=143630 RepID=UPI0040565339